MGHLSATAEAGVYDLRASMTELAAKGGPGFLRQSISLLWLSLGPKKIRPEEYYTFSLWRKDRGRDFVRDFVSNRRMRATNLALNMPGRGLATATLNDKLAVEAIMVQRGLPFSQTRAVFAPPGARVPDLPYMTRLTDRDDIAAFLGDAANLPVFGKPRGDSFARGAAAFAGLEGPEVLRLASGATAPVGELADEIARDWRRGYLFQPFYQCAPALRAHVGGAMASVRIVTLWTDRGIEPWYAVIRLPAPEAMHDGDAKGTRIWGLIDLTSGKVVKLRSLRDPHAGDLTHGNDPALSFLDFALPDWDRALDLCRQAHESFPGHGIIGWDVFLTPEGAILNEANASPGHVYQVAAQRPLLNPDLRPAYARALAFARKHGGGKAPA